MSNVLPHPAHTLTLILAALLSSGCKAASAPSTITYDHNVQSFDGLYLVQSDVFETVFARDPLDVSGYNTLTIEPAPANYRHPDSRADDVLVMLTREQRTHLQQLVTEAVGRKLRTRNGFAVAGEPAATAITLWGALVDINVDQQDDGTVVQFILVAELRDSLTEEPLMRAIQHYYAPIDLGHTDENWQVVQAMADDIAQSFSSGLDTLISN